MNKENLTIHLKVKEFSAWRTSYNGREQTARPRITNGRLFRNADDQNDVVILRMLPTWQRPAPGWAHLK